MVEMLRQEAPSLPKHLEEGLKRYDPRLRLAFDLRRGLWKVEEQLRNSGTWSFVTYWAEGAYPEYRYRHLPPSIDPILAQIDRCDMTRHGTDLAGFVKDLESRDATERAKRKVAMRAQLANKLSKYIQWARERAHILDRRFAKGGRSREAAIRERTDVLRDLQLRKD